MYFDGLDRYRYTNNLSNIEEWARKNTDASNNDELTEAAFYTEQHIMLKDVSLWVGGVGLVALGVGAVATAPIWGTAAATAGTIGAIAIGVSGWLGITGCGLAIVDFTWDRGYDARMEALEAKYAGTVAEYNVPTTASINGYIPRDPSGFVYEAVLSNTIEGAEASVWHMQTFYDQYDEPYEKAVLWDAETYEQINPQITDAEGTFFWDVPEGLWQVRVMKNGYEDAESDWLPVPPIQTDVHIGIVSLAAPQVEAVTPKENTVTLRFDKYMDVSTLQNSVSLSVNGTPTGTLSFPDAEADPKDETKLYARSVSIALLSELAVDTELSLTVTTDAKSYAGVALETEYQYEQAILDVSSLAVKVPELTKNQEGYITLIATPASAAEGRTVTVSGDLEALGLAEGTVITLNSYGRASLPVTGQLYGIFQLHFSLSNSILTADADITVDVKKLSLVKNNYVLAAGLDFADNAMLTFTDMSIAGTDLIWTSNHPEVVSVDNGLLTAVSGGMATVTGTMLGKSVSCTVHVLDNLSGLQLPAMLTEIDEEAFRDSDAIQYVVMPQNLTTIGDYAFADDDSLLVVYIPASVSVFGESIFAESDAVTVFVDAGSDAEAWCRAHDMIYQYAA